MSAIFTIDKERCKSCEFCVVSCPKKLFSLAEDVNSRGYHYAEIKEPEKCILCLSCSTMCPECAIGISKE